MINLDGCKSDSSLFDELNRAFKIYAILGVFVGIYNINVNVVRFKHRLTSFSLIYSTFT